MIYPKEYYLDIFQVTERELQRLVGEGLLRGGDFSDLFFENTAFGNLVLRDGEVTSGGLHSDFGVGIRVLKGEKTGYAYSESTGMAEMTEAAKAASAIACGTSAGPGKDFDAVKIMRAVHDKADNFVLSETNGRRPGPENRPLSTTCSRSI